MSRNYRKPATPSRTSNSVIRGKHADQDAQPYATKYSCATHQVTYYQPSHSLSGCPVCDLEREVEWYRVKHTEQTNLIERLTNERDRLRVQVDIVSAIKDAVDIVGTDDLLWLKTILYRYKIDKSVTLKVTHAVPKIKARRQGKPNGFIAIPRSGEMEAHECTSIGGTAVAGYFEEAVNSVGSAQAMALLTRAFWKHLPGASE